MHVLCCAVLCSLMKAQVAFFHPLGTYEQKIDNLLQTDAVHEQLAKPLPTRRKNRACPATP